MVSFGFDESTSTLQARNPSPSLALGAACCSHGCSPRRGGGGAPAGAREGEAAEGRRARGEARLAGAMRSAIRGAQSGARIPRRTRPDPHARPLLCGRRRRQLFCSRGAPAAEGVEARAWARRGRHVPHGIGSVASVGPKGRQVASAGRLCRRRRCAEPADRPVLARAGSFAGAGSCRHRRPRGRRHLPRRHQLSALLVARAVDRCAHLHPSLLCPPARGVAPLPYLPPSLDALCPP